MLDGLRAAARRATGEYAVRSLMSDCRRLLSERGEANSATIARSLVGRFEALVADEEALFFERLLREFNPDPKAVLEAAHAFAVEPSADHLGRLTQAAEPPRQELLRRINRLPGGTAAIVGMRRALLGRLAKQPELRAVEADFLHLLSSWFNPGFLQLQKVDWNSPAQLLEQLIRHEAVHAIDGWDDLRRRLEPDRRCFAFLHPQLPAEPLIFVEVALLPEMPDAIAPLLAKSMQPARPEKFRVAAFYSISNCQPGLKGVSLGNFLIKRVAEELKRELPQLRSFCTLSPMPGFARWVRDGAVSERVPEARMESLAAARRTVAEACGPGLEKLSSATALKSLDEDTLDALTQLGAFYLAFHSTAPGGDPVARFHLDNGARLERLDPLGDLSAKGVKQSFALMVNYLYDLERIEAHHEQFIEGKVAHSRAIASLF